MVPAGLLKWVLAMVNYYNVAKGVEPKRKKVAEAEKNLRLAQKDLAQTKDQLAALNSQLADLRTQFANKTTEQQVWPGSSHTTTCCRIVSASALG
jgi:dynein heavy chain